MSLLPQLLKNVKDIERQVKERDSSFELVIYISKEYMTQLAKETDEYLEGVGKEPQSKKPEEIYGYPVFEVTNSNHGIKVYPVMPQKIQDYGFEGEINGEVHNDS